MVCCVEIVFLQGIITVILLSGPQLASDSHCLYWLSTTLQGNLLKLTPMVYLGSEVEYSFPTFDVLALKCYGGNNLL